MKKKFAVIGYGGMGSWHVNHALKSDVLELAGIWDIDIKKRDLKFAKVLITQYGGPEGELSAAIRYSFFNSFLSNSGCFTF